MSSDTPTNRNRRRPWPRYSLRTLFIALTVFGVVGGYWMNKTYRQRAAVRCFSALTAEASPNRDKDLVTMGYRHQRRDEYYKPIIPKWLHPLRDVIGEEAFGEVTGVQLTDTPTTDDDLRHLASVPTVERIWLDNTGVTDDGLKLLASVTRCGFSV